MDNVDSDQPQAKPRRQQKEQALEHCQGYVDKNGMWNNGFYCPRWGGPDDVYCCGDGGERFCCPQPVSPAQGPSTPRDDDSAAGSDNALAYLPVVIGVSVGLFVFILGLVVGYFVCPCCPGRHSRHRKRSASAAAAASASTATTVKRTLSVSLEAEATSAVIAAQALAPVPGCQISPAASSSTAATDDVHLHCGCRWSPSTSRSTVVDVESTALPTYHAPPQHSPALPVVQTDLENMYNCSCEKALLNDSRSLRRQGKDHGHLYHLLQSSTAASGTHAHAQVGSSSSSPICLESFRPSAAAGRCSRSPCHLLHQQHHPHQQQQQQQRLLSRRLHAASPPLTAAGCDQSSSSSSSTSSRHGLVRGYGALTTDADRQRRDSGVLVEDTEPADAADTPTAATSILPMPELVVERIGRFASAAR